MASSDLHSSLYSSEPEFVVRSPGRAEIIGNHVDYCGGAVLAGAIAQATTVSVSRADDPNQMLIYSDGYSDEPHSLDAMALRSDSAYPMPESAQWFDYAAAVVKELVLAGVEVPGFEMAITSTVPSSGGVSSSASFEVGVAKALCELAGHDMALDDLARLCQRAEHAVGSNCGLLDQFSVALGEQGSLLKLDFLDDSSEVVAGDLGDNAFVVVFDPSLRRQLGDTGYVVRRQACELGLVAINKLSDTQHATLRGVSIDWFNNNEQAIVEILSQAQDDGGVSQDDGSLSHSDESQNLDPATVVKRLRHVVSEMARVEDATKALVNNDAAAFGALMTASGHSALVDYELDEGTPELTHIVETCRAARGVLGVRNMGGGFSSVSLALVENDKVQDFTTTIASSYKEAFGGDLEFLAFEPSAGVAVVE